MTSSGGGPLEFHNIQEIVDIELMFELTCMFFLSSLQIIRKEETNNKTVRFFFHQMNSNFTI